MSADPAGMGSRVFRGVRAHGWAFAGSALLLTLVATFAYAPTFAVDFFWHLKLGELIATSWSIPDQDLFSAVHPERPYVQFQWLWELIAYLSHQLAGLRGVRLLQVTTMVTSFVVLGVVSLRVFENRALSFFFCALALVLFEDRFQTRPSATALGFVACLLPWFLDQPRGGLPRQLLALLAIGCAWSNLHGGESLLAILGLGALAFGTSIEQRVLHSGGDDERRRYLALGAVALGVAMSPTLFPGMRDWSTAIQPQLATGNKEWRATYTMLENGFTPSFVLIGLGPSLLMLLYVWEQTGVVKHLSVTRRLRALPLAEWLLCGGMFVLAQQAVRNAFLCLVPLAFMLRRAAPRLSNARGQRLVSVMSLSLLLAAFDDHVVHGYGGIAEAAELVHYDVAPATFPEELAEFMREARIEGGILNDGRWGGYLIWQLWPQNHVFVDTRHNLTASMWPIFMGSHAPGTRQRAMQVAAERWGVELSTFRGPTFAAVHAPPDWQLLYKAGDQELYQYISGKHATENLARARAWLREHADHPSDDLTTLATRVGAARWLRAPYQVFRARKASTLLRSDIPADVLQGRRIQATLLFDAGSYAEALTLLQVLLQAAPDDLGAAYKALLAALAVGNLQSARHWLRVLARRQSELTPLQLGRLHAVERAHVL